MTLRPIDISLWEKRVPAAQPLPQVQWIAIADMVIDETYQRPLGQRNITAIAKIADAFNWAMFSPLIVAPIEGGKYAVIDGQHRAHAAAVCGFTSVPAMITTVSHSDQAASFVRINTGQIRASATQVYRARLAAGDAAAKEMDATVTAAECRLMTYNTSFSTRKPGEVYCVALIESFVKRGDKIAVALALKALRMVFPDDVSVYDAMLLGPWIGAVAQNKRYESLPMLCEVLRANRPWLVIEKADRATGGTGKGTVADRRAAFVRLFDERLGTVRR